MSGKGDTPRPIADREKYNSEFDRIFNKDGYVSIVQVCKDDKITTYVDGKEDETFNINLNERKEK